MRSLLWLASRGILASMAGEGYYAIVHLSALTGRSMARTRLGLRLDQACILIHDTTALQIFHQNRNSTSEIHESVLNRVTHALEAVSVCKASFLSAGVADRSSSQTIVKEKRLSVTWTSCGPHKKLIQLTCD